MQGTFIRLLQRWQPVANAGKQKIQGDAFQTEEQAVVPKPVEQAQWRGKTRLAETTGNRMIEIIG